VVGDLIRLKLAITRHSVTGSRAVWAWSGATTGAVLAAGVVVLAAWPLQPASLVPDLLAVAYLTWLLGWVVGPVMSPAPPLRPAHLAMLPLPRHRLAVGLLVAGFVGLTTAVTALLFTSLVVYAARLGVVPALLAVPLAALQVSLLVLLSRVAHVAFGRLARARAGAALNGVVLAIVLVLSQSGWMLVVGLMSSGVLERRFPDGFSAALRWAPSGWALAAVETAADGDWARVVLVVAAMLALAAVLLVLWGTSLGEARGARAVVRGSVGRRTPRTAPFDRPVGAIVLKELRTWWRDPARSAAVSAPLAWGVLTAVLPLTFGAVELLPWAGTLIAIMAASWLANMYSFDGTGLWLTLQTGTERVDVRARQWAYLIVYGPIALLLTIGFTAWSGLGWAWPWALAAVTGAVGGGAGLVAYTSVFMPEPGPDAHERAENPAEGTEEIGSAFLVFFAAIVPPLPGLGVVYLGTLQDSTALRWAGVLVGVLVGALLAWGLGRLAAARLERTAPEMLLLMRSGRPASSTHASEDEPAPTGWDATLETTCWTLGILATVPQGLLTMLFKLTGNHDVRVWFLAMYLPEPWGWLTSIGMVLLGGYLMWIASQVGPRAGAVRPRVPEAWRRGGVAAGGWLRRVPRRGRRGRRRTG
jgi:ABC-2 type transport system permease protein